ncbi:MAG TPA: hypothetical protein PKA64_13920 [Myxococcota bacterium]|nr:hypothetical protein [Myxococcota bacterium]
MAEEQAARPGWAWRLTQAALALLLVLIAVPLARVAPLFRDDHRLDWIVVAVALDWRDFGKDVARQRLQYELDHQGVGGQVGDQDCELEDEEGGGRRVACAWSVTVELPWVERRIPLSFTSVARVDQNGLLVR